MIEQLEGELQISDNPSTKDYRLHLIQLSFAINILTAKVNEIIEELNKQEEGMIKMLDKLKEILWELKLMKSPSLRFKYEVDGIKPDRYKTRVDRVYDKIYPEGKKQAEREKHIYKTAYEIAIQDLAKQYAKEYEARKKREEMEEQRVAEKQRVEGEMEIIKKAVADIKDQTPQRKQDDDRDI